MEGNVFVIDAEEYSTYLTSFVSGNRTIEAKLLPQSNQHNGRLDFMAPTAHYEVFGVNNWYDASSHNVR